MSNDLSTNTIFAVAKALKLLKAFTHARGEWTISDLAREIGTSKPTLLRHVNTLEQEGFLMRNQNGRYELGYQLLQLADVMMSHLNLNQVADPHMRGLVREFDETAYLAIRQQNQVMVLHRVDCSHSLKWVLKVGDRFPLTTASLGKIILANLSEDEQREQLCTVTGQDRERLQEALQFARKHGYVSTQGERLSEVVGISVPLFGVGRRLLGGLALSIPRQRFNPELFESYVRGLKSATTAISATMGYSGDSDP